MPKNYFFVARPETIISIIHTGKLPDRLAFYIQERTICLFKTTEEALNHSSSRLNQSYLISLLLPDESPIIIEVRDGRVTYVEVNQLDLTWLSKIYVSSAAGQKLITRLCNNQCPYPIEIAPDLFEVTRELIISTPPTVIQPETIPNRPIQYLKQGDVLGSRMLVHVNTVNCVGVMGKGIALAFKQRYPAMFRDYKEKCNRGEVQIGKPYLYYESPSRWILNFPTKQHWKNPSSLQYIEDGLKYFVQHAQEWGITSIAFPPLGCGNGGLNWDDVYPLMMQYLDQLNIPIEIHSPFTKPKLIETVDSKSANVSETSSLTKRKVTDFFDINKHQKLGVDGNPQEAPLQQDHSKSNKL